MQAAVSRALLDILARGHCLFMSWPKYLCELSKIHFHHADLTWLKQEVASGFVDPSTGGQREKGGWWDTEGRWQHRSEEPWRRPVHRTSSAIAPSTRLNDSMDRLQFIRENRVPTCPLMTVPVIPFPFRDLLLSTGTHWMLGIHFRFPGCKVWATGAAAGTTHLPKFTLLGLRECFPTDLPGWNEM